ncbi:MAG: glycosyltransferase, partial [Pseudomonadota bacterium]
RAWLTYHCHYKAPDLVGPAVARALGLPYLLVEPSLSPRRLDGPWARFAQAATGAVAAADALFWTTERDRPALEAAGHASRMTALPPFLDPGPGPARLGSPAATPPALLTVAMMRPGDKVESYRRLARALRRLVEDTPFTLTVIGDGPARAEVEALFAPFGTRLPGEIRFTGAADPATIRAAMEAADLLAWPGVGEGIGYVWLEAAAAGLPAVAEDGPAARDVVTGRLAAPGEAAAFAAAIRVALADRPALSRAARVRAVDRHGLETAAGTIGARIDHLVAARAAGRMAGGPPGGAP